MTWLPNVRVLDLFGLLSDLFWALENNYNVKTKSEIEWRMHETDRLLCKSNEILVIGIHVG